MAVILASILYLWILPILGILGLVAAFTYFGPILIVNLLPTQNLKSKYAAKWGLVTGSSSGIGLSIATKLAQQGLNVVLVARDDQFLKDAHAQLSKQYPKQEFRAVPVNLGAKNPEEYMSKIREATKDIEVTVVMNNAGYLLMGFFNQRDVDDHISNIECNALSGVRITHYFVNRMIELKKNHPASYKGGCVCFTSSAAQFLPTPFASMYGAGKAFVTEFAMSISVEVADHEIDILAIHPSYTSTNLYSSTPKLGVLNFLAKFAATPDDVADAIFRGVGRVIALDLGWYGMLTRVLPRIIDICLLVKIMIPFRKTIPEYKAFAPK